MLFFISPKNGSFWAGAFAGKEVIKAAQWSSIKRIYITLSSGMHSKALSPLSPKRTSIGRYAAALLFFMLSLLVRFALASGLGSSVPYITFFPAIMLSAWYGGLGPGLLITGLSAVAALYLFLAPLSLRITNNTDLIGLIVFLAVGAVISCLNEALHQAHCRVESELLARRESEDALAESEEQYRVMTEAASDGIITIDAHSTILLANNAAARIFGYPVGSSSDSPSPCSCQSISGMYTK